MQLLSKPPHVGGFWYDGHMNENTIPGEHEGEQDGLFSAEPYDKKLQSEREGQKVIDAISAQVEQERREAEARQAVLDAQFEADIAGLSAAERIKALAAKKVAEIDAHDADVNPEESSARQEETSPKLRSTMRSADAALAADAGARTERDRLADEQRAAALPGQEAKRAHVSELLASFREDGTLPPRPKHSRLAQGAIDEARINKARRHEELAPENDKT